MSESSGGGDLERPSPASVRISDTDRDRVIGVLRTNVGDGRLTLDEFSERAAKVYGARTAGELAHVVADLPVTDSGSTTPAVARRRRAVRWLVSILGSNQAKGRFRIENELSTVSILGGCTLDLRQAEVVGDEAIITTYSFMGGVDVIVPEGIEVVLEGFSFLGGKTLAVRRDIPILPGSPLIRVRAFSFLGGVTVRSTARQGPSRPSLPDRATSTPLSSPSSQSSPASPAPVPGIEAVAGTVRREWSTLRTRVAPEGTVTILFSDIEGFTAVNERLGDYRAQDLLREHYRIVRDALDRHDGYEVKVNGDGFMVAFSSANRALRCAVDIQRDQELWNEKNKDTPMLVRMGLHTGEAIRDADDFLGTTVNLASRIANAARGGEILVSALLKELCTSAGEFMFAAGREVTLKGLSQPQRVYSVDW